MSPKFIGDVNGFANVDYSLMAYLTRGTPDMPKFCYEGTNTPKAGYIQISRLELSELNIRSSQRKRIENWVKNIQGEFIVYPSPFVTDGCIISPLQAPIGVYPPTYLQVEPPLPKQVFPEDSHYCGYKPPVAFPPPRYDPPVLRTVDKTFVRTEPLNLPPQEILPVVPKHSPVEVFAPASKVVRQSPSVPIASGSGSGGGVGTSGERERVPNPVSPPNWGARYYELLAEAYVKWKTEQAPSLPPDSMPLAEYAVYEDGSLHPTCIQVFGKTCSSIHSHFYIQKLTYLHRVTPLILSKPHIHHIRHAHNPTKRAPPLKRSPLKCSMVTTMGNNPPPPRRIPYSPNILRFIRNSNREIPQTNM